ncbi:conserved hypothetical protein [Ketogulonicigenium vulgare Y25]|uniref:Uncharacterized conserved protein UCP032146 n=1 Tax=Ketogulonicigenium vulgare (strain WSH-001) TaxID=759362 RepID=F9YA36_KETVW|nr:UPF0262 family protein [Ketogulonicigenium vulgare]ADO43149.1 conserved hypothetical protein [Ketogulonicigenium vulgare Y25]AEM41447.1 uncharacterized conserved protein UCP032146 [Ketogulonicigenium vulgare WSH-001]ALJ81581.1 hypothetical protein KVH_10585 [Ketogulonicigenium vulgare]AOZ55186.1 hypothetical protein KVC_2179 [Ketogulonicigenium vulgare]
MNRLIAITLAEGGHASHQALQERQVAIRDLLEENAFAIPPRPDYPLPAGPYRLHLALLDRRLHFTVTSESHDPTVAFQLALGPFRQVFKDYAQICGSYHSAVKSMPPARIEAIDMARRGIHNEGASILQERLHGKAELDAATARRLFTLVSALCEDVL